MLILVDDTLHDCPDDLAALILVDPSCGDDLPDFSIEEVNAIVHGVLGTFHDENLSWEANIEKMREHYATVPHPAPADLAAALKMVENYNQNIKLKDVACVPSWLLV